MHTIRPNPALKRNFANKSDGCAVSTARRAPLVLFLPGYSLIATLFPRKDDLDAIERIALSFGLSIAITPLLGLALNYTPFGIRLLPILIVLSVFTILLALGAYVRGNRIPEEDRLSVVIGRFIYDSHKYK